MPQGNPYETILAFDVGARRIGVARAHLQALFPQPLTTLDAPDRFVEDIVALCQSERAGAIVIGLPRGMSGQDTAQTTAVRAFGERLQEQLQIPVYWTDEALTSAKAEAELQMRGRPYVRGDIDALAATYILEDFITHQKTKVEQIHG
ncbi:MAG TPA: Holliday junction resolvase RuvX [Candidatus Saccharimonadales bacterium]|nr:Holliday junction resolvase RuvX [Candidatus Saccharimonadales bacterium]